VAIGYVARPGNVAPNHPLDDTDTTNTATSTSAMPPATLASASEPPPSVATPIAKLAHDRWR
jgi:hypothetical protein